MSVFLQRAIFAFCVLVGNPVGATNFAQCPINPFLIDAELRQYPASFAFALAGNSNEQMLGADELVF